MSQRLVLIDATCYVNWFSKLVRDIEYLERWIWL